MQHIDHIRGLDIYIREDGKLHDVRIIDHKAFGDWLLAEYGKIPIDMDKDTLDRMVAIVPLEDIEQYLIREPMIDRIRMIEDMNKTGDLLDAEANADDDRKYRDCDDPTPPCQLSDEPIPTEPF